MGGGQSEERVISSILYMQHHSPGVRKLTTCGTLMSESDIGRLGLGS